MTEAVAVLIGLVTGATMPVAVSCVWGVLHLPARIQDRFRAGAPQLFTRAITLGLMLSALRLGVGLELSLPDWGLAPVFLAGGMFVGMLASALGEILEVTPIMLHRFRLDRAPWQIRTLLMVSKGLGAVLACLVFGL